MNEELAGLLERYRRGAELMAVCMTGAAGSELDYVAAPGKWSIRQIICHVSDSEIVGADRIRRIVAEENPALTAYDQEAWAKNLDYHRRKTTQAMETFRRIRGENHELLKGLSEETFARRGNHSERGSIALVDLVKINAEHVENHVRQIREIRAAFKASKARV
jgi:hypothetical protein